MICNIVRCYVGAIYSDAKDAHTRTSTPVAKLASWPPYCLSAKFKGTLAMKAKHAMFNKATLEAPPPFAEPSGAPFEAFGHKWQFHVIKPWDPKKKKLKKEYVGAIYSDAKDVHTRTSTPGLSAKFKATLAMKAKHASKKAMKAKQASCLVPDRKKRLASGYSL